jgi:DNA polymerase III subunit epsilon
LFFSSPPWDSVVYWSLDLETGGFNARTDALIAVGMVPIRDGIIRLGEAYRTLVQPADGRAVDPGSIRAHQLVWGEIREAPSLSEVLPEVDRRLREGVMLVHHRSIDLAFLRRAYAETGMRWPAPRVVDTVDLLVKAAKRRRFAHPEMPDDLPALNLSAARRELDLPDYQAHDALTDAVATAELFLVLRQKIGARTLRALR